MKENSDRSFIAFVRKNRKGESELVEHIIDEDDLDRMHKRAAKAVKRIDRAMQKAKEAIERNKK